METKAYMYVLESVRMAPLHTGYTTDVEKNAWRRTMLEKGAKYTQLASPLTFTRILSE